MIDFAPMDRLSHSFRKSEKTTQLRDWVRTKEISAQALHDRALCSVTDARFFVRHNPFLKNS
jgi:hypothetical protein